MRLGNIKGFALQKTVMASCWEEKRYITNKCDHYFIKGRQCNFSFGIFNFEGGTVWLEMYEVILLFMGESTVS